MLECILRAKDGSESTLIVPSLGTRPPARIRIPSQVGGASVVDVYQLSYTEGKPSAPVFEFVATVPRATDEVATPGEGQIGPQISG